MSDKSLAVVPFSEMEKMAEAIAKSRLFAVRTPEEALTLMFIAVAEGLHPAKAFQLFHIFNGKPSMKADAMLAGFQESGGRLQWIEYGDDRCEAVLSHPTGGEFKLAWDMERAKQAGLGGKDNWKHYPRQMLSARVISEGIRKTYPGCQYGMYTPEEVSDFSNGGPDGSIEGEVVNDEKLKKVKVYPDHKAGESDKSGDDYPGKTNAWGELYDHSKKLGLDWEKARAKIEAEVKGKHVTADLLLSFKPRLDEWKKKIDQVNRERDQQIAIEDKKREEGNATAI